MPTPTNASDNWVERECAWVEIKDPRLILRLKQVLTHLADKPNAPLPQACHDLADLKATYRFLDKDTIEPEDFLLSHQQATLQRIQQAACPVVLAVQDTCLFDFTPHPKTKDLGPLATPHQQGFLAHHTLAFPPDKLPLGVLEQQRWVRDPDTYADLTDPKQRKIEDKESVKWLTSLHTLNALAPFCPETTLVSVGDREADVYDLLVAGRPPNVHLLVRAPANRRLEGGGYLKNHLSGQPVTGDLVVRVPARAKQPARTALVSVRFATLRLRPPKHRASEHLPLVEVGVVLAREEHPPSGVEALCWYLVTSLPVTCFSEAIEYVGWYTVRWQIEVWHKILKSGCDLEAKQLETFARLERCLALYSIVAWRVLSAVMLGRQVPSLSCEVLLSRSEWEALYCHLHGHSSPPRTPPSLGKVVGWLGRLGGHLGRKGDGPPGVTVIWRGFQRLSDLSAMYRIFRPSPTCG